MIRTELVGRPDESALLGKPLADATPRNWRSICAGDLRKRPIARKKVLFVAETPSQEDLVRMVRAGLLQPIDPAVFSPGKPIDQLSRPEIVPQARATLDADRQHALFSRAIGADRPRRLIARIKADVLLPSVAKSWGLFRVNF